VVVTLQYDLLINKYHVSSYTVGTSNERRGFASTNTYSSTVAVRPPDVKVWKQQGVKKMGHEGGVDDSKVFLNF